VNDFVLDASAILAMLYGEAGWEQVGQALASSILSSASAAEVVTRLVRDGAAPIEAVRQLQLLPCRIESVDEAVGLRAGQLFAITRAHGLSLGDRICIALGEQRGLPVLTADKAWKDLDLSVEIVLIR
jgi:ribonuclease VapC